MSSTKRLGAVSTVILVVGISLISIGYSLVVAKKQTKASEELKAQLAEVQSQAAKSGVFLSVGEQADLPPVNIDEQSLKAYDGQSAGLPFSFKYPANFVVKEVRSEDGAVGVKIASDASFIEAASVPKGQVLLELTAAQMSWLGRDLRAYKETTPYAVQDRFFNLNGDLVAYETVNKLNDATTWIQTVLTKADTRGNYTLIKLTPDSPEGKKAYSVVLQHLVIK